jgi:hypothetical protein
MFDDRITRLNKLLRRTRDGSSSETERQTARNALFAALDGMAYGPYDVAIIERGDANHEGLEKITLDLIKAISEKDEQILDLRARLARQSGERGKPLLGSAQASKRTQEQRVLDHLRKHCSITTPEANRLYGFTRLPARIDTLRKKGHVIAMQRSEKVGSRMRFARYTLVKDARDGRRQSGTAAAASPPSQSAS